MGPGGRSKRPSLVYLSLGSNLGGSIAILRRAVESLAALPGTRVVATSRLYRTAPVGYLDQPDFVNQVAALETVLPPLELLDAVQALEHEAGREPGARWGPRTLDIDILWYDGLAVQEERLELPHPRLGERRFVLEPWAELAPDLVLPSGRKVRELLAENQEQRVEVICAGPTSGSP